MKQLFTAAALDGLSLPQLRALFAEAQCDLVRSDADSHVRQTALRNLETIGLAIARKHAGPRP